MLSKHGNIYKHKDDLVETSQTPNVKRREEQNKRE